MTDSLRSNVDVWKELQEKEYFGTDRNVYSGTDNEIRVPDDRLVERFRPLTPDTVMAVIGSGYGREATIFGKRVKRVYGIDVSDHVLSKAVEYTRRNGVNNFVPVVFETYKTAIPDEALDLVYSIVVMQHLTRDLVRDYFRSLARKLKPGGAFVVQFYTSPIADAAHDIGPERVEQSVAWSRAQLQELCTQSGLVERAIETMELTPVIHWSFVHFERPR